MKLKRLLYYRPLIILSIIFSLSGVVNLGFFGIIPALPFLFVLLITLTDGKNPGQKMALLFFVIAFPLYILKHMQTPIFYPAQGGKVLSREHLCLISENSTLKFTTPSEENSCTGEVIPAGTEFRVDEVVVSHLDLPDVEKYFPVLETRWGPVKVENTTSFIAEDGTILNEPDLRRGFFYGLSMLMYFPTPRFFQIMPTMSSILWPPDEPKVLPSSRPIPTPNDHRKGRKKEVKEAVRLIARREWENDVDKKYVVYKLNLKQVLSGGCEGFLKIKTEYLENQQLKTFIYDGAVKVRVLGPNSFEAESLEGNMVMDPGPQEKFQFVEFKQKQDLPVIVIGETQELEGSFKNTSQIARSYQWTYEVNVNANEEFIMDILGKVENIDIQDQRKFIYHLKCIGKTPQDFGLKG